MCKVASFIGFNVLPVEVQEVIRYIGQNNLGQPLLVGGCVRDAIMGRHPVDFDIEVQSCPSFSNLSHFLAAAFKNVNLVGKSFGVLKVGQSIEVSVPRADNKVGSSHKDFQIDFLPMGASFKQASLRRDLTVNSIGYDPVEGKVYDPYEGCADINAKILRCVDEKTFGEDPLRPWRVVQFAARLGFFPNAELIQISREVQMDLSGDRIFGEVRKWLKAHNHLVIGWKFLTDAQLYRASAKWESLCTQRSIDEASGLLQPLNQLDMSDREVFTLAMFALMEVYGAAQKEIFKTLCIPNDTQKGVLFLQRLKSIWIKEGKVSFDMTCLLLKRNTFGILESACLLIPQIVKTEEQRYFQSWNGDIMRWFYNEAQYVPVVRGRDLCELGVLPGEGMGQLLDLCHRIQVEEGVVEKERLIQMAQRRF